MVDLVQYRFRIGTYRGKGGQGRGVKNFCSNSKFKTQFSKFSPFNPYNRQADIKFYHLNIISGLLEENVIWSPNRYESIQILSCLHIYLMLLLISIMLLMVAHYDNSKIPFPLNYNFLGHSISYTTLSHIKSGYFCLISYLILKYWSCNANSENSKLYCLKFSSRMHRVLSYLILYLLLLNFLLIGIINPNLLNPGPKSLKICYQNVQGLIPFKDLSLKQPSIDKTKIHELNTYISQNRPDIVILNETWLKKCIHNHEIIKDKSYEIFRNDRSQTTHPPDPNDPKKFRKFGGGVLIAIRLDIQADIKPLSTRKGAEMKAIEITINDKKYIFCTAYRVGTLGEPNHTSIINTLKTFYKVRQPRKIFLIGDLNLSTVSWPVSEDSEISSKIERLFIDSFFELGLDQCITDPTHIKGRTLDLLVTNYSSCISNLKVFSDKYLCKSDHYLVTFQVNANVKYNKTPKRKILNFKKANWDALNNDLSIVNWNAILDCLEPELAWRAFKHVLSVLVHKHIPVITIKTAFTSPWFDSECFEAYREKERAHKKFKSDLKNKNNNQSNVKNELDFKHKRYLFKKVCDKK